MPDNKEIPNQNTLFSSSGPPHSPPKSAEPTKGADTKAPPTADSKKSAEPPKAPDTKATPAADGMKPAEPAKAPDAKSTPTVDGKKSVEPPKAPDTKATPAADAKKPAEPPKAPDSKVASVADGKKPAESPKAPDAKAMPVADAKKPAEPPKVMDTKPAPAADSKKPTEPPKVPDSSKATPPPIPPAAKTSPATDGKKPKAPSEEKAPPATSPKPAEPKFPVDKKPPAAATPEKSNEAAKDPVKGVKITQVFADRLDKPDDKALKDLPIPKEGEGFSIRLHPDYFFDFLDHPFSVNREVADYKDLYDSIKANGINEPVKARPREGGGLELISGHRRHDIAKQLNYPVPVIIEQVDTNDAQIECVDGNLHRQDIPTSELARAAKMKMEALARKAGRRSKMDQLTGPSKRTDQIVAEDMGMSRNQVNRLVRIDSLVPELKQQVDDKKLPFNTAVELSYLKPEEQGKVVDYMKKEEVVPSLAQATQLKEASKAAQEAEKAAAKATAAKAAATQTPAASKPQTKTEEKKPAPVDEKKIASIVKPKAEPEQKYVFTSAELKEYFPNDRLPTTSEVKRKVFDALDFQKKAQERQQAKQALKESMKTPAR